MSLHDITWTVMSSCVTNAIVVSIVASYSVLLSYTLCLNVMLMRFLYL